MNEKVIARVNCSGFLFICPEFWEALNKVAKKMKVNPSPAIKGQYQLWKERKEFPYWFLAHHVCMNGAKVVSRHPDLEPNDATMSKSLGASYEICLQQEDTIERFCERMVSSDYFMPVEMGLYIDENGIEENDSYSEKVH
jgi:hypothetical protein